MAAGFGPCRQCFEELSGSCDATPFLRRAVEGEFVTGIWRRNAPPSVSIGLLYQHVGNHQSAARRNFLLINPCKIQKPIAPVSTMLFIILGICVSKRLVRVAEVFGLLDGADQGRKAKLPEPWSPLEASFIGFQPLPVRMRGRTVSIPQRGVGRRRSTSGTVRPGGTVGQVFEQTKQTTIIQCCDDGCGSMNQVGKYGQACGDLMQMRRVRSSPQAPRKNVQPTSTHHAICRRMPRAPTSCFHRQSSIAIAPTDDLVGNRPTTTRESLSSSRRLRLSLYYKPRAIRAHTIGVLRAGKRHVSLHVTRRGSHCAT